MNDEREKLKKFKEEIGEIIRKWYDECPRSMEFTTKVIKCYKEKFGEDYAN